MRCVAATILFLWILLIAPVHTFAQAYIIGRHPADQVVPGFFNQNSNADQIVDGLNAHATHTLTGAVAPGNGGGGGSATNALTAGPGGNLDAGLVTNVQASKVVGSLTNNTTGSAATAVSLSGTLNAAQLTGIVNQFTSTAYSFTSPQFGFVTSSFQSGTNAGLSGQGLFFTTGANPLILPLQASAYYVTLTNSVVSAMTEPKIMVYCSNGVPIRYICSFQAQSQSGYVGAGFTTSADLTNWTPVVMNTFGSVNGAVQQWSDTVFEDATNGLHYLAGVPFSDPVHGNQRIIYCVDLSLSDLSAWYNPRPLIGAVNGDNASPGAGFMAVSNGMFYLYTTTDNTGGGKNYIYTNVASVLTSSNWVYAGSNGIFGSSPSMVNFMGTNWLYYAYGSWLSQGTNGLLGWNTQSHLATTYNGGGSLFQIGLYTNAGYTIGAVSTITLPNPMALGGPVSSLPNTTVGRENADSIVANGIASGSMIAQSLYVGDGFFSQLGVQSVYDPTLGYQYIYIDGQQNTWVGVTNGGPFMIFDLGNTGDIIASSPIIAPSFQGSGGRGALTNLQAAAVNYQAAMMTTNPLGQLAPDFNGSGLTNQGFARTLTGTNMLWTPTVQADGNTNWSGAFTNVPGAQITGTVPLAALGNAITSLPPNLVTNGISQTFTVVAASGGASISTNAIAITGSGVSSIIKSNSVSSGVFTGDASGLTNLNAQSFNSTIGTPITNNQPNVSVGTLTITGQYNAANATNMQVSGLSNIVAATAGSTNFPGIDQNGHNVSVPIAAISSGGGGSSTVSAFTNTSAKTFSVTNAPFTNTVLFTSDGTNFQYLNVTTNGGVIINTNFNTGQIYANIYGAPLTVTAGAALTTTAVAGMSQLAFVIIGSTTNYSTSPSLAVGGIVGTTTNFIGGLVPVGAQFYFTNTSQSAGGDTSIVVGGQISYANQLSLGSGGSSVTNWTTGYTANVNNVSVGTLSSTLYYTSLGGGIINSSLPSQATSLLPGWYGNASGNMGLNGATVLPSTNLVWTFCTNSLLNTSLHDGVCFPTSIVLVFSNATAQSGFGFFCSTSNSASVYVPPFCWGVWLATNNAAGSSSFPIGCTISLPYHP